MNLGERISRIDLITYSSKIERMKNRTNIRTYKKNNNKAMRRCDQSNATKNANESEVPAAGATLPYTQAQRLACKINK